MRRLAWDHARLVLAGLAWWMLNLLLACRLGEFLYRRHVQTVKRNIHAPPICIPIEPFLSFL